MYFEGGSNLKEDSNAVPIKTNLSTFQELNIKAYLKLDKIRVDLKKSLFFSYILTIAIVSYTSCTIAIVLYFKSPNRER